MNIYSWVNSMECDRKIRNRFKQVEWYALESKEGLVDHSTDHYRSAKLTSDTRRAVTGAPLLILEFTSTAFWVRPRDTEPF